MKNIFNQEDFFFLFISEKKRTYILNTHLNQITESVLMTTQKKKRKKKKKKENGETTKKKLFNPCPAEYIKMSHLLLIFSQSDYLIRIVAINSHA